MNHVPSIEWIAHRGASFDAPENTMGAIELAWRQDVDAVEIDVRLTRDGRLVLCHDEDAHRVANSPKVIADSMLEELLSLDFGGGQRIATIEEALKSIPAKKRMFVEIKCGGEALEPLASAIRETAIDPGRVAIISFHPEVIRESKKRLASIPAYFLIDGGSRETQSASVDRVIAMARDLRADGVDLSHQWPIDAAWVNGLKSAGLSIYIWTVDDPAIARRMIAAGVDGITSNRAAWLRERLYSDAKSR